MAKFFLVFTLSLFSLSCDIAIANTNTRPYRPLGLTTHLKSVSATKNYIWGVNSSDHIHICNRPCSGNWRNIAGLLKQVDVNDYEVWGVNRNDYIYKRPVDGSGAWVLIAGRLKHVSASGDGYIWGVNSGDRIYKCKKPCSGGWIQVDGRLKQIDGGLRYVYGVNSANQIWRRPVDGSGSWAQIPGSLKHVTASAVDEMFGVGKGDEIYRCKKPCVGDFKLMSGYLSQCDGSTDLLVGVNNHQHVYAREI